MVKISYLEKKKEDSKPKKRPEEQQTLNQFAAGLGIVYPQKYNFSENAFHALRADPDIKKLNRVDANAVMTEVFKKKIYGKLALISMKKVIERFEEKLLKTIERERSTGNYKTYTIDTKIQKVALIMKMDYMEAKQIIATHVIDPKITASSFWTYLNETAIEALKNDRKWSVYLTMNSLAQSLFQRGNIPFEQWIVNASLGFDESQFRREQERKKERNLQSQQYRQTLNLQNSLIKNWGKTNNNNKNQKGEYKKKTGKKRTFKQIMADHDSFLRIHAPNTEFITDYCAFWNHPTEKCRYGDKCQRAHKCHNCDGNHDLHACPEYNEQNKNQRGIEYLNK